jgi:hypothetical protein
MKFNPTGNFVVLNFSKKFPQRKELQPGQKTKRSNTLEVPFSTGNKTGPNFEL